MAWKPDVLISPSRSVCACQVRAITLPLCPPPEYSMGAAPEGFSWLEESR
eukprot:CAMPEP_0183342452 /NCGR_PEP_ID=MMETSP0164_2-20130417/8554_1 /TAXON_ID=221442 /ORGANISM="Coccolithus pelagicus ssp braarudi, Strain PLY182g" /LENGTH=49 /DNA_ID= /DNA_START= /DNA_END= /DNA_ORIENTATION=